MFSLWLRSRFLWKQQSVATIDHLLLFIFIFCNSTQNNKGSVLIFHYPRSDGPRRKPELISHLRTWNKRAKPYRQGARVHVLCVCPCSAVSSSVILRYQTEIHGADTNRLFMGRDRDPREYVQKSHFSSSDLQTHHKCQVKGEERQSCDCVLSQGISKTFALSWVPSGYRRDYRVLVFVWTYCGCKQTSV